MKFSHYLNYFFYITFNWNIRLAIFTIRHEIRGEKKYSIDTGRLNDLKKLSITGNNIRHAEIYQGANYFLLEKVFTWLQAAGAAKNFIDYGCGKGRALVVAAFHGFTTITGIDFAKELCEEARKNIAPLQTRFPGKIFNVVHINAVDYVIDDDINVFFFFNPFNEVVMLAVVKNILKSLKSNPREVYAVYANPIHKEIFLSAGFKEVFHFQKLYYIQASILRMEDNYAEYLPLPKD